MQQSAPDDIHDEALVLCTGGVPGRCELGAITASQISAALILFAYVIVQVASVAAGEDDPIGVQLTIASAFTILYIFLCFWLVEEKLVSHLRNLRPLFSIGEFAFRISLLAMLFLMPTFVDTWIPTILPNGEAEGTAVASIYDAADPIVIFLALLYLMFLVWDGLIFFGAPDGEEREAIQATSRSFVGTDFLGFVILLSIQLSRFVSVNLSALLLFCFILFSAVLIYRVGKEQFGNNIRTRLTRASLR